MTLNSFKKIKKYLPGFREITNNLTSFSFINDEGNFMIFISANAFPFSKKYKASIAFKEIIKRQKGNVFLYQEPDRWKEVFETEKYKELEDKIKELPELFKEFKIPF